MSTDSSFEKAERAHRGSQQAIWSSTLSWDGPLQEYGRISTAVRPGLSPTATGDNDRRILFLGWEVDTYIREKQAKFASALQLLNEIFFHELGFSAIEEGRRLDATSALLGTALARRQAPESLLSMLYAWIGESVSEVYGERSDFSRIDLVSSTPTEVVRVIPREDRGLVWLVNLHRCGDRVEEAEWSQWCAANHCDGFTRLTGTQALVRNLMDLFKRLEQVAPASLDTLSAQLFVLDRIISLQPSETSRWAERAMINTKRGDRASALDDLKRFFAFHERETAPQGIVALFDDLRAPPNLN